MKTKIIFLLVLNFIVISVGQDNQPVITSDSDTENPTKSLENGVKGLVKIVHSFLKTVQSEDFVGKTSGPISFTDVQKIITDQKFGELSSRWRDLVAVFGGFAACVVIGLLFVFCMPLAGCITCCCYCCCKKCGKASSKEDPKNAKCKRVTFASFLFIFTVLILVGAIFSVISNEILHSKLENVNDQGPIGQVKSSLNGLVDFAGETADEIVKSSETTVKDTVKELLKIIKGASEQTVEDIQNSLNATDLLNQVESLGQNANISAESLTVVTREVTALKDLGGNTTQKLNDVRNNITAICNGSNIPKCPSTSGLNLATDFSQLDNLANIGNIVQTVTDISTKASQAREQFDDVKDEIQTKLATTITKAEKKTNETRDDILKEIPSIKDTLNNITKNLNLTDGLNDADESIKQYGDYVWYAFIGVPCLTLLVVVFYLFGLLFGLCGERPGRDARCCNKGAGSNMLCCGVLCSYLIGSLIMFVVILMFIPFGLLYTNGCRYLNDGVENIERFEFVVSESMGYNISAFIDPNGKSAGNITVGKILGNCKKNMGVYNAFHLENLFSLDEILNMTRITSEIDKIVEEGSKASLGNISIIPADLKEQLNKFSTSGITNINFTQYDDVLDQASVPNLSSIMDELNRTAMELRKNNQDTLATQLMNEWETLLSIQQHEIPLINQAKGNLTGALDNLRNQTNLSEQVQNVIDSLTTSQNTFNRDSTGILKEGLVATSQKLVNTVSDQLNKVKTDIRSYGKCEPVYKNVQKLSDAFCVTFLDPVNSIWFGLGWGLAFFIPAIIFALLTANLYQREEPYDTGFHRTRKMLKARDKEESTFDNPDIDRYQGQGYDAYGGPGADNIPLTGKIYAPDD
ncbi:prominin-1-A-like isoform X2 [Mytilus californianus]|uniref:prominin-1-A-like isoform X2 n=1 Tax=Mytilus californianus TaxID=6549 RepID=UPI0022484E70|nr:prominin-1-A-like isoform X2 [Mytilus californianus]